MSYSIYEIDGYQDYAKPSWVIDKPNYYLQDVYFMNRPEMFNFDGEPGEGSPYYKYYPIDQAVQKNIKDEFKDNYKDQNLLNDSNEGIMIRKKGEFEDITAERLVSLYNLEHNPINLRYVFGPHKNIKKAVIVTKELSRRIHYQDKDIYFVPAVFFSKCITALMKNE